MQKIILCIFAGMCCALLLACDLPSGCDQAKTIELTQADDGQTVAMNLIDEIKVVLPSNPSTGYQWVNMLTEGSTIVQVEDSVFTADPDCGDRSGCGGTETFTFEATKTGTGAIKLFYMREWETEIEPLKQFAVTVVVH